MKLRGLRQARQRQGLSISQLAELTGLRRESISRFEHGQEEPQPYALRRLAAVLAGGLGSFLEMQFSFRENASKNSGCKRIGHWVN